jgi:hypothetical protein
MSAGTLTGARPVALHRQWRLALMLLALHGSLAWGIQPWWAPALLLAHFGLFLLWQPVFRGEREVRPREALIVLATAFSFVLWHSWWLMAVWVAVLLSVIAGRVPRITERSHRVATGLAALYLLSLLLMWVVPHLFAAPAIEPAHALLVQVGLPLLPLALLLVRVPPREDGPVTIDLVYSVLLFLLVAALVLGSFVVRELSQGPYALALAQTLFGIALLLLALWWLWHPRSGFVGMGHLLSTYVMSLGLPFERWVHRLAALADEESEPQRFLARALEHMCDMPWVRGVEWRAHATRGECGVHTAHATPLEHGQLELTVYTRWPISPAMLVHLKLLAQMVAHFYEAKRREQLERQNAYAQAIYETGARLTHDVKNLLQSLRGLCAAAQSSRTDDAAAFHALAQRQLPQIAQRLEATLEKLKAPRPVAANMIDAVQWWEKLVQRYGGCGIELALEGEAVPLTIPGELFDTVADNLIENARRKTAASALRVRVAFWRANGGMLIVCDDGAAIPQSTAAQLFAGPVGSQTGLGIGLYQSAKLAGELGYELVLAVNEPGKVCFMLRCCVQHEASAGVLAGTASQGS